MSTDNTNIPLQLAKRFVNQTNRHVFLTGKAGTGKTTFLKYIKETSYKKLAVIAPTGVAAMNAGGMTIHSFFNLPFGTFIPTMKTVWGGEASFIYNKNQLFHKAKLGFSKRKLIQELDLLIIDEISMVRADVLDAVDTLLRSIRKKQTPFGGLQMLFIGDPFQLPPVVKDSEWDHLKELYSSPFFFDSQVMQEANPVFIELSKIYRQQDEDFIALLNRVRNNTCTPPDFEFLHTCYKPDFTPEKENDFITLTSHNYKADAINQKEIQQLPGELFAIEGDVIGDYPPNAFPVDKMLHLKRGAQIMFVKNDKGENRRYFNGKIGIIDGVNAEENSIQVKFPQEDDILTIEKETWKNIRYQFDEEKEAISEEELGSFSQFPIRLAWAVTIHKSQGLTFERAMIDAGRSFASGQVYVALSRLTSPKGLVLQSPIYPGSISTDPHVLAFSEKLMQPEELLQEVEMNEKAFAEQSIFKAFEWDKIIEQLGLILTNFEKKTLPNKDRAYILLTGIVAKLRNLEVVGQKFSAQLHSLLQEGDIAQEQLHKRTVAAASWFLQELTQEGGFIPEMQEHIKAMKLKKRTQKYVEQVSLVLLNFERKKNLLDQAVSITEALAGKKSIQELMEEVRKMHHPAEMIASNDISKNILNTPISSTNPSRSQNNLPPSEEQNENQDGKESLAKLPKQPRQPKGTSHRLSLQLFKDGQSIKAIATERALAPATIESHLISFIPTGEINVSELVTEEKSHAVRAALTANINVSLSAIKEALGTDFSYLEIKAVIKSMEKVGETTV